MFSKKVISDILAVILFTALIVFVIGACLSALYAETSIRPLELPLPNVKQKKVL